MVSGNLNRRHFVAALAAGGLLPTFVVSAATQAPTVVRRWASGNATLAPLALLDGHIFFNGDKTLGRIDPDNAALTWNIPHRLSSNAVYRPRAAGVLVISGGRHELGGWAQADGQPLWLHKAILQVGTPFVDADHTYVGDGHWLLALNNQSGAIDWRFAPDTDDCTAAYAPTVAGETVFFGPGDGKLYAVNRADGKLTWKLDEKKEWQYVRQMYVTGKVLVAGTYTELLYGINVDTGKVLWKFKAGNFINSHHVAGDTAYLWSPTGWIYAIDVATGRVRWRHQTTRYGKSADNWGHMMAEIVTFENQVFCLDMKQVLHVLDVADGRELQRIPFAHDLRPTVSPLPGRRAVMASDTGEVQLVQW
ncbi:PQQ-like beta-propeller repeat protein [Rhodoferax sp.]|uniref:PQQ-like beta-propeller repeat protein n=1 Tax=Rhodoferax sp. TaxID=50421 RepID=UPI0019FC657F|nr:PQQ-like beta-propeller repeat protein [Rhodoferax sp.]MBE0473762.1 PQQ-like beta-propeller repeat protein [Rhodoferax sp.]